MSASSASGTCFGMAQDVAQSGFLRHKKTGCVWILSIAEQLYIHKQ
jgi:hypothetical protein